MAVNTLAPRALAEICCETGAQLLHFSTDFVFDGRKGAPYAESDVPNPINVYGFSNMGASGSSWPHPIETSFVERPASMGRPGPAPKAAISFKRFCPARKGANRSGWSTIFFNPPPLRGTSPKKSGNWSGSKMVGGIFHLTNGGGCSWFQLAQAILELSGCLAMLTPIASAQWPGKMRRSPDTRLVFERLASFRSPPLRPWRDALTAYLKETSA